MHGIQGNRLPQGTWNGPARSGFALKEGRARWAILSLDAPLRAGPFQVPDSRWITVTGPNLPDEPKF